MEETSRDWGEIAWDRQRRIGRRQQEIGERPRDWGVTEIGKRPRYRGGTEIGTLTAGDWGETERKERDRDGKETAGDWGQTQEIGERQREIGEIPRYSLGQTESEREETKERGRDRGETERDRELRDTEKLAR